MNWSVWIPWQELGGSGTNQNIFKLLTLDNNGPGAFVFNELSRNFEAPKTETRVSGQRAKKSVCFFMHNFHYDSRRWMHWFSLVMTPINRPWFRNTKNHGTQNFEERLKKNNLAESVRCSKFESCTIFEIVNGEYSLYDLTFYLFQAFPASPPAQWQVRVTITSRPTTKLQNHFGWCWT